MAYLLDASVFSVLNVILCTEEHRNPLVHTQLFGFRSSNKLM
jgi:hypothetical protein